MDSATQYLSKNVSCHGINSKVTVVNKFQKFRVDTPLKVPINPRACVVWTRRSSFNWGSKLYKSIHFWNQNDQANPIVTSDFCICVVLEKIIKKHDFTPF